MKFNITEATNKIRGQLDAALEPDSLGSPHKSAFQAVLCAVAGLPNREASIAYVLGVVAGVELDAHDKLPLDFFRSRTREAEDYATGIKDALLISAEYRRVRPSTVDVISTIFGNPFGEGK